MVNTSNTVNLKILAEKDLVRFTGKFKFIVKRFNSSGQNIVEGPMEVHVPPNCEQDLEDPSVVYRDW